MSSEKFVLLRKTAVFASFNFIRMSKRMGSGNADNAEYKPPKRANTVVVQKSYKQKSLNDDSVTFLDERSNRIWELHNKGNKPGLISDLLNSEAKLKKGAGCTGKAVSDWIRYKKKAGHHGTFPVSLANNNLRAEKSDSCM